MATTTTKRLVTRAMRKLGVLARTAEPKATELADAKSELKTMLDTWRLEKLMVVANSMVEFELDPAKRLYTYSSANNSDFISERPVAILSATVEDGAGQSWPLDHMTVGEYNALQHPDYAGTPSRYCYFASYPQASIGFDCIPMQPTLRLVVQAPLIELPATDTTEYELPPGYEDAIIYNLALRIAPDLSVEPDRVTIAMAGSAKRLIKDANFELPRTSPRHPQQNQGRFDITNFGPR